jgi:putative addiction module component (TIGR02574 family)
MAIQIEELLSLPIEERRSIAEQLLNSLEDEKDTEEESKEVIAMLDNRWDDYVKNKNSSTYSADEFKQKIRNYIGV